MASVAIGGACWLGAVKMLTKKDKTSREEVLQSLKPYLKRIFNSCLTDWLCNYWWATEQDQLHLMHNLTAQSTGVDESVMMLSMITAFQDIMGFRKFAAAFVRTANPCAQLFFDCMKKLGK
jgi:hypothetical protein